MSWDRVELQEVARQEKGSIVSGPFGSNISAKFFVDDGVPVIRGNNLSKGAEKFIDDGFAFLTESKAAEFPNCIAVEDDIVFTAAGSIGQVGIIPPGARYERYVISNKQLRVRLDHSKVDPLFVYAWLSSPQMVRYLENMNNGGAVPLLNRGIIRRVPVPFPPIATQMRIADIVSAYDDLIENNRRRMALLEETARQLYREWFVRLRFPGHEHTRIAHGVPEGWERINLEEICVAGSGIQTGPFGSQLHQSDYADSGIPVVMPKDLVGFRVDTAKIARIPEEIADRLARHRLRLGDTVYGRRGDIGRRAFIGERQAGFLCGTGSLRIRPDPQRVNPRYLFDTLGSPETAGTIANRAKGATMLNLNQKVLKSVPVLLAPRRLQDLYGEQVREVAAQCELLDELNRSLGKARDLLLPRLMSGEIAV